MKRADSVLLGLVVLMAAGSVKCEGRDQSDAICLPVSVESLPSLYCGTAFRCRDEFTLSDAEFVARFGADRLECRTLDHEFVIQASSTAETSNGAIDPELENCVAALIQVPCAEVQSDALIEAGRPCHPDVISGQVIIDEQYPLCSDEGDKPGCL